MKIHTRDGRVLDVPGVDPQYRQAVLNLICPYCGAGPFKMLAGHTQRIHGVGSLELKDLAGLVVKDSLVDAETRVKKQRHGTWLWDTYGRPKRRSNAQPKKTRAALAEQQRKSALIAADIELVAARTTKRKPPYYGPPMSRSLYVSRLPEIRQMLDEGLSKSEISRRLNIPLSCVSRLSRAADQLLERREKEVP